MFILKVPEKIIGSLKKGPNYIIMRSEKYFVEIRKRPCVEIRKVVTIKIRKNTSYRNHK